MYELNFKYELDGFSEETSKKIEEAIEIFKNIYLGKQAEISRHILEHIRHDGKFGFSQTDDNNLQVLNKFFSPDAIWIKFVADYKKFGSARAYTYPKINAIYLRVNKIDFDNTADVVNTIAHEFCHKKGLTHTFKENKYQWPFTAPYSIGNFFESIVREIPNTPQPPVTKKISPIKKIFRWLF